MLFNATAWSGLDGDARNGQATRRTTSRPHLADAAGRHRKVEPPARGRFRELREETGVSSVEIIAEHPDWLTYELPRNLLGVALKGRYRGQRQRWFAMRFSGTTTKSISHRRAVQG